MPEALTETERTIWRWQFLVYKRCRLQRDLRSALPSKRTTNGTCHHCVAYSKCIGGSLLRLASIPAETGLASVKKVCVSGRPQKTHDSGNFAYA